MYIIAILGIWVIAMGLLVSLLENEYIGKSKEAPKKCAKKIAGLIKNK